MYLMGGTGWPGSNLAVVRQRCPSVSGTETVMCVFYGVGVQRAVLELYLSDRCILVLSSGSSQTRSFSSLSSQYRGPGPLVLVVAFVKNASHSSLVGESLVDSTPRRVYNSSLQP